MTPNANDKLSAAAARLGGLLSVGLEPAPEYLPAGIAPDLAGYEAVLRLIVRATRGVAAAYKFNLAFFEALGPAGWDLMFRLRADLPAEALVIADAKRSDIGSSARRYAQALYEQLDADAATVNPLMGRDSVEPFLAHEGKLTFALVLTSNPGAADFLVPNDLYRRIAERLVEWDGGAGRLGFVAGATRDPARLADLRALAPAAPFLVPGVGAQGGDLAATWRAAASDALPGGGLIFHVTRGILPDADDARDPEAAIRARATDWIDRLRAVAASSQEAPR